MDLPIEESDTNISSAEKEANESNNNSDSNNNNNHVKNKTRLSIESNNFDQQSSFQCDDETSQNSGQHSDEPKAKKRRKQSNPVRYGQTSCPRPLSYIGDEEDEDESTAVTESEEGEDQIHLQQQQHPHHLNRRSSKLFQPSVGINRFLSNISSDHADEDDVTDERDDELDDDVISGERSPGVGDGSSHLDLSTAAAAAAAAALNYSQISKFHLICPHCGCPFMNKEQLKDHIEEEHVQKVLEQQLLHHQQQQQHHHQQQQSQQQDQQYKKTPNGVSDGIVSTRLEAELGPLLENAVKRSHQRSRLNSSGGDRESENGPGPGGGNGNVESSGGESCSNSPLSSPNLRKTFDSSLVQININNNNEHNSMTVTGVNSIGTASGSGPMSFSGSGPNSAKDYSTLLSFQFHGVPGGSRLPPKSSSSLTTTSTTIPSTSSQHQNHHQHQQGQHSQSSQGEGKGGMPLALFPNPMVPYLFNVLPGSGNGPGPGSGANGPGSLGNGNGGSGNNLGGTVVIGGPPGNGAIHNGQVNPGSNPVNVTKIFNPEAYCELCNKELCNKYFLKTHKANKHGIYTSDTNPTTPSGGAGGANSGASSNNPGNAAAVAAQAAAAAAAFNSAAAAAYFQTGLPAAAAQSAAMQQMQHLLHQASSGNGPANTGNGGSSGGPADQTTAAAVALATRSVGLVNLESYCDICQKKFCNKYFLKKHRSKIHGIMTTSSSSSVTPGMIGSTSMSSDQSQHQSTSLINLSGLASDRCNQTRSVSPASSTGGGDAGLPSSGPLSLVSTKLPLSPVSSNAPGNVDLPTSINNNNNNNNNNQSSTTTTAPSTPTNLVSSDRGLSHSNLMSLQQHQTQQSHSSPPCPQSSSSSTNSSETYCELCRVDLANPLALQAHRALIHNLPPNQLPSSWTRDQWQTMMASLQTESFAFLGRPNSLSSGSENNIFNTEKLREMGVINADAYCEICRKELCNKYFLRTHKLNKHGIGADTASNCGSTKSATSVGGGGGHYQTITGERHTGCLEDNSMSPRSSGDENSNQGERRSSQSSTPSAAVVTMFTSTPTTQTINTSSTGQIQSTGNNNESDDFVCEVCSRSFSSLNFLRLHKLYTHEMIGMRVDELVKQFGGLVVPGQPSLSPSGDSVAAAVAAVAAAAAVSACGDGHREGSISPPPTRLSNDSEACDLSTTTTIAVTTTNQDQSQPSSLQAKQLQNQHRLSPSSSPNQASQELDKLQTMIKELNSGSNLTTSPATGPVSSPSSSGKVACVLCRQEFENGHFLRVHMMKNHDLSPSDETYDSVRAIFDNQRSSFASLHGLTTISSSLPLSINNNNTTITTVATSNAISLSAPSTPGNNGFVSESELTCEICYKVFQSKSSLRAHRMNIHGLRNGLGSVRSSSASATTTTTVTPANLISPCGLRRDGTGSKSPESDSNQGNMKSSPRQSMTAITISNRPFGSTAVGLGSNIGPEGLLTSSGLKTSSPASSIRSTGSCRNYCNICNKELCNKYFMKTHMLKMHGINVDEHTAEAGVASTIGGVTCDICQKDLCSKYFLKVHKQNTHGISEESPSLKDSRGPGSGTFRVNLTGSGPGLENSKGPPSSSNLGSLGGSIGGLTGLGGSSNDYGVTSDKENSVGIDPSDTGNRYFSHYTEVCPLCERRFKSIKWLKTHMANDHSDLMPFRGDLGQLSGGPDISRICVICGQICSDRIALQIHMVKDHKANPEDLTSLGGPSSFFSDHLSELSAANNSGATDLSSSSGKGYNNNQQLSSRQLDNRESQLSPSSRESTSGDGQTLDETKGLNLGRLNGSSVPSSPLSPPSISRDATSLPEPLINQIGSTHPQASQSCYLSPSSEFPKGFGAPKSPPSANYIIQTFLMTTQPESEKDNNRSSPKADYFVPSLVCLPVSQKILQPVTVSFQLTPAAAAAAAAAASTESS